MNSSCFLYTILPFKHKRLHNGNLVIVNEAGEYYFLSPNEWNNFITLGVRQNTSLFLDLKSKHFLTDTSIPPVINLLATKYRTKKGFLRYFTALHMMVITLRCNHKCKYCQVSSDEADAYKWDMKPDTAVKIVDLIFSSPSPHIKIEFQGGEPLLNWNPVKTAVEYAEKKNKTKKKWLEFVICTNLMSIDEEKLNYIKKHNINISTSLDGPKYIHDKNRVTRNGSSSYDIFCNNLKLAREIIGEDKISALMTTSRLSLKHIKEIIDEYVRLGFPGIFLRSLNPYGFATQNQEELGYSVDEFLEVFREAIDYIISLNLKGTSFAEYYTTLLLTRILTPFSTGFMDLQSPAGTGICGAIYDYNGDVFPSDEARMLARSNDRKFFMGNVYQNSYMEIFNGPIIRELANKSCVESMPGCFSCAFQLYCGADPIRNYVECKDIIGHRPTSHFCKKNFGIIEYLLEKINKNDENVMDVFWSWLTKRSLKELHSENIQR
jgi:His-Xaa-Ser system radical SAM maturase HxsB